MGPKVATSSAPRYPPSSSTLHHSPLVTDHWLLTSSYWLQTRCPRFSTPPSRPKATTSSTPTPRATSRTTCGSPSRGIATRAPRLPTRRSRCAPCTVHHAHAPCAMHMTVHRAPCTCMCMHMHRAPCTMHHAPCTMHHAHAPCTMQPARGQPVHRGRRLGAPRSSGAPLATRPCSPRLHSARRCPLARRVQPSPQPQP